MWIRTAALIAEPAYLCARQTRSTLWMTCLKEKRVYREECRFLRRLNRDDRSSALMRDSGALQLGNTYFDTLGLLHKGRIGNGVAVTVFV
jgi:hypothetical protein